MQVKGKSPVPKYIPTAEDLIGTYCRTGSAADFEQIVRRYAPVVFGECRRVTRNPHDAEDAAQLTFLALAMELKVGKTIHYPSAWLQRVARHQAIKIVRSRGRRQKRENAVRKVDLDLPNEIALDAPHNSGVIRDEIDHLSDRYRLPLVLHYFGGMSLEMIANELKIGKQTVGTRLHRARKMLATKLSAHGIEMDATVVASALAVVVPAAVVASVVRTATFATPRASFAFPSIVTHLVQASAITGLKKWMRGAVVASAILASGAAVGNVTLPSLSQLPKLNEIRIVEWVQRWISTELRPRFTANVPALSSAHVQSVNGTPTGSVAQLAGLGQRQTPVPESMVSANPNVLPGIDAKTHLPGEMHVSLASAVDTPPVFSDVHQAMWNSLLRSGLSSFAMYSAFDALPGQAANLASTWVVEASPVPEPTAAAALAFAALCTRRRRDVSTAT